MSSYTLGLLLMVVVTAASLSDQAGARKIFKQIRGTCKKLRKVWVDGTYRGAEWTAGSKSITTSCWNLLHVRKDKKALQCYRIAGSSKEPLHG